MKQSFWVLAVAACALTGQPADCKTVKTVGYEVENRIEILNSKPGWDHSPNPYITTSKYTVPVKGNSKLALPSTPMGAAVRQPGDYLYQTQPSRTTKQVRQGKGLVGLPDTNMSATVGMAGDHVGRQSSTAAPSYNQMGLPSTSLGATVGKPGDGMRSDLRNNGYKRFPSKRPQTQQTAKTSTQPTETYAATYGSYDGTKKRNY